MPLGLMSHGRNIAVLHQRASASPSPEEEGAGMLHVVHISHQNFDRCFHVLSFCVIYLQLPSALRSTPSHYFREISTILLPFLLQTKDCSQPPWHRAREAQPVPALRQG